MTTIIEDIDAALRRRGDRQLEQARRIAASLEAEVAKVRELHQPFTIYVGGYSKPLNTPKVICRQCGSLAWPCLTAQAVYLT